MRFVILADTHCRHEELVIPPGDILVHIGDFCNEGTKEEALAFIEWFENQPHTHKVLVAGNHDCVMDQRHWRYDKSTKDRVKQNIIYLENETVDIEGLKIFGWPYVAEEPEEDTKWAFTPWMMEPRKLEIPQGVDVVLSHCPPYGIRDIAFNLYHIGCNQLLEQIDFRKPRYHIFGHCHNQRGVEEDKEIWPTTFINATCHGPYDSPLFEPFTIDIDPIN